jgi:large subunit ribosomal protein L25
MSDTFLLNAELRSDLGKGASRRLRRLADQVPAVIYGAKKPPQTLSLVHKDILKVLQHEAFFSSILTIEIDGKKEKAILKDMQRHPSKPRILHMDFMRISATDKMTMNVPLHFIGEDIAAGVKEGGMVSKLITELEVKCLPSNLPESINIDITNLEINGSIHISAITLPKGVELAHVIEDEAHDQLVVAINVQRVAEEIDEEADVEVSASDVPSDQKDNTADVANDKAKAAEDKG